MTKAGELDWSDLYKTGKSIEPEDPLSQPLKKNVKTAGEQIQIVGKTIVKDIIKGYQAPGIKQPTDQELFGSLVKSKEEIEKAQKAAEQAWENKLNNIYKGWQKPPQKQEMPNPKTWGKSYNQIFKGEIPEEEMIKRNLFIGKDE